MPATPSTSYQTPAMNFNGTPAPINFKHKRHDIVLQNGDNDNIARSDANYLRITGPAAAFSISGFDTPLNGMILYVHVAIAQQLTLKNKANSPTKNQIDTLTNSDVVITSTPCVITFLYDGESQKWVYGGLQAKTAPATGGTTDKTPVQICQKIILTTHGSGAGELAVSHDLAAVVEVNVSATTSYLLMLDVSDPRTPILLSQTTLPANILYGNVQFAGKFIYIGGYKTTSNLFIYDVSNPYAPSLVR